MSRERPIVPAGVRPRAEFGQHFLVDAALLRREVDYAGVSASDTVLEIGPGIGNLTERLLERAGRVVALEIDRQFQGVLGELAARHPTLELRWEDATSAPLPAADKVVANLPYGPALPLVFRLLEAEVPLLVVMVQASLAERLAAEPGGAAYGGVTVRVRRLAAVKLLERVRPHQFQPPPRVDSSLLRLRRVPERFPLPSEVAFRRLLDNLFLQRGAPLEQALRALAAATGEATAATAADAALRALPRRLAGRRVHDVSPNDFGRIAWAVDAAGLRPPEVSDLDKRRGGRSPGGAGR